ncbi:hypothetical protein ACP4OV_010237 [Aristida adscensionis]
MDLQPPSSPPTVEQLSVCSCCGGRPPSARLAILVVCCPILLAVAMCRSEGELEDLGTWRVRRSPAAMEGEREVA